MSMVYLIALYCLVADPPNPWDRRPAKAEAPACFEYREEYADTVQVCNTRGVMIHSARLRQMHGKPFVFQGAYCREVRR
jgi:hypothetical protein